ncbi:MAG: prephenate dehydratase [Halobacteria archaeon]|nr:prephenate dehydratase [Halobacteria archaeon]
MIGTLGPQGTYSHLATLRITDSIEFYEGVHQIADAVVEGDVDSGVVPIENSIEGSVNATLDVLTNYDLYVTSEIIVEVHHALLSKNTNFDEIASHPQALAQCRSYINKNYPDVNLRGVSSTAKAVEIARENEGVAAIAHPDTAGDLNVIAEDIQDTNTNTTRFVRLSTRPLDSGSEREKTTIIIYPGDDRPGLLYDILEVFKDRNINLTRIESRPSKRELGDYVFHLDFENKNVSNVDGVLSEFGEEVEWVDYLGSYDSL